jgi:hypothetical protein
VTSKRAKQSGNKRVTGANRNLDEQIAAVTQSLGGHLSERWEELEKMIREIYERIVESENRIRANGMVTERDQHLIEVVKDMFGKLPKLPGLKTPEERWEKSRHADTAALLDMLHPFKAILPPALWNGLNEHLRKQPSKHMVRWALVYEAHFIKKLSWPAAYEDASERLADTLAGGRSSTMKSSYLLVTRASRGQKHPETLRSSRPG